MITSIVAQICANSEELPVAVARPFDNAGLHGRSHLSISDSPILLLKTIMASLKRLCIIVDSIDECEDPVGILSTLQDLVYSRQNVHLLVLSRNVSSIRSALSMHPAISIGSSHTDQDIRVYLAVSMKHLPIKYPAWVESITKRVVERSNGMFLFAHLIMDSLAKTTSPGQLLHQLEQLPSGISAFYAIYLERLAQESDARQLLAKKLLRWICSSRRPLSWAELQSALADGASTGLECRPSLPFKSAVLELGSPFVVYDEQGDLFHLQHLSMRDFLVFGSAASEGLSTHAKQFHFSQAVGERELASVCLTRMLTVDSANTSLREYAAVFWCDHLLACPWSGDLHDLLMDFTSDTTRRRNWIRDMLRYGNKGFSLQKIFKMQAEVNIWIRLCNAEDESCQVVQEVDWSKDVVQTLLLLSDGKDRDDPLQLDYFEKLIVIRDLARFLNQRKRLVDGIRWLEAAHKSRSCRKPRDAVWILNSLAILYDQQGETLKALETQKQALSIQEAELDPLDLETTNTINELGRIYRHLGDYDNASQMHLRALAVLEARVPDPQDDLQVIWTISTLARTYRKQNRVMEALKLFERSYEPRSRVLGPKHPHTLWILGDMGACYLDMRSLQEAENCHRKALEGRIETLGPRHSDTLWSMNDLGVVLAEMGRKVEALALQERALDEWIQVLGKDHKHTIWTRDVIRTLRKTERDSGVGMQMDDT